jgi:hypothetical protein
LEKVKRWKRVMNYYKGTALTERLSLGYR